MGSGSEMNVEWHGAILSKGPVSSGGRVGILTCCLKRLPMEAIFDMWYLKSFKTNPTIHMYEDENCKLT